MEITLNVNYELFKSKLIKNVTFARYFIFDITPGSTPEMLLEKLDDENYVFSYSRPIIPNIFKFQPCDYKFMFSFKEDKENLMIKGSIRLKKFTICALLLMLLMTSSGVYNYYSKNDLESVLLTAKVLFIVISFLFIEYFFFKMKIRKFFRSIID